MKKIFRKIISMAILIAIIFSIPVLGSDLGKEDIFDKHTFNNLEINANLADVIKNEFNDSDKLKDISIDNIKNDLYKLSTYKNHMAILLNSAFKDEALKSKMYSENFAGSFIDEELNLNICLTNSMFKEKYLEFFNDKLITQFSEIATKAVELPKSYSNISDIIHVNFIYCENSYNELTEVYDNLKDNLIELGISQLYIKESDNKIYAHIKDNDAIKSIESYLKDKNSKLSIIKYMIDETEIIPTATYYAYGGRKISRPDAGYGTIMCNAFDSNGKYGVVTNAHVAPANTTMKNEDDQNIGKTSIRVHNSYMDAAFVPFNNTLFTTWKETAYVSEVGSNIYTAIPRIAASSEYVEGARVVKYGVTTGRTIGTILAINTSATSEGSTFYNLVKFSNNTIPGDSGGPVILNTGLPNAGNFLAVICTFGSKYPDSNPFGLGFRAYHVEERLGVTLLTNTTMP